MLHQAIATQQQTAPALMKQNPAFFGVGVGQSLDDPQQAALVIYVDKNQVPAQLPQTIDGLRTRYIIMDRLHVTRSYLSAIPSAQPLHGAPCAGADGWFWFAQREEAARAEPLLALPRSRPLRNFLLKK